MRAATDERAWSEFQRADESSPPTFTNEENLPDEAWWRERYGKLGPVEREAALLARVTPQIESLPNRRERERTTAEFNARHDALQVKRRAALGITEDEWQRATEDEQDSLLATAYDAFYDEFFEARRRAQHKEHSFDVERLRGFYAGESHIPEVTAFADGVTALIGAQYHFTRAGAPVEIKSRILAFAEDVARARMRSSSDKPWPDLPRFGLWIDVLWDDTTNPPPRRPGKPRLGEIPPGYPEGGGRRLTQAGDDVRKPWRKVAAALGSAEESDRLRAEWTEIMFAMLEVIERRS